MTSCFLAALLAQTLGLPLEAVGEGRQMDLVTVFGQVGVQVFALGCEQGDLLALPFDQVLLCPHLLLQAPILVSQLVFFACRSCTVNAFSTSGKFSRTPE